MPGAVVGWLLLAYLLAAVLWLTWGPAWDLAQMEAEPTAKVKVIGKYAAWNISRGR